MHKYKDILTTGQVARICKVAPRTVSKWFDNGQLRGYRIPGSKDRRIMVADLVRFMRMHGLPLNGLAPETIRVLIVDADSEASGVLGAAVAVESDVELAFAGSAFEAGMLLENLKPTVMVVDVGMADLHPQQLCRELRTHEELRGLKVVAAADGMTPGQGQAMLQTGFDAFLAKPYGAKDLLDVVERTTLPAM